VRSAVIDWPISYAQQGPHRADYFGTKFEKDLVDAQRLDQLLETWRNDSGSPPLRLLIGYIPSVDSAGHKYGPEAPEMRQALLTADMLLEGFIARAQQIFRQKMRPDDRLIFLFTTDHGMSPMRQQFIVEDILGDQLSASLLITHSGNVANIHLDNPNLADEVLKKLKAAPHVRTWKRSELPERWQYAHPTRTGDVVAVLDVGYGWKSRPKPTTTPATKPVEPQKGNHGYAVEEDPDMMGFMLIWSPQESLGGKDLGRVDSLALHPTVAKWLGIKPAERAIASPIAIGE
jgi:predicted AlkP superfamily pyrophosphatase or phosphodiesterase